MDIRQPSIPKYAMNGKLPIVASDLRHPDSKLRVPFRYASDVTSSDKPPISNFFPVGETQRMLRGLINDKRKDMDLDYCRGIIHWTLSSNWTRTRIRCR